MNRFSRMLQMLKVIFYYKWIFKNIGLRSIVISPLKLENPKNISIANGVLVGYKSWLATSNITGSEECSLEIMEGCSIGNFSHIYATRNIRIEKNVLIADKVYISDNLHGYKDIALPIIKQPVKQIGVVVIGEGSWIGENACILGVLIGRNCVIGSNAVVTKDIPDFSVAVGAPAKIIKRYCQNSQEWLSTHPDGSFK